MKYLYLMVGPSGCGKSTLAKTLKDQSTIIISSDELRSVICKNINDQSQNNLIFRTAHTMTDYFFQQGYHVIVDATNLTLTERKHFIQIAHNNDAYVIAHVFGTSMEECKKRNKNRDRVVPEDVIEKQFGRFNPPIIGEVEEVKWI